MGVSSFEVPGFKDLEVAPMPGLFGSPRSAWMGNNLRRGCGTWMGLGDGIHPRMGKCASHPFNYESFPVVGIESHLSQAVSSSRNPPPFCKSNLIKIGELKPQGCCFRSPLVIVKAQTDS